MNFLKLFELDEYKMESQAVRVLSDLIIDRGYILDNKMCDECIIEGHKDNEKILCFICDNEKLNIQGIKDRLSVMKRENAKRAIIIYRTSVTASAKKSLETIDNAIEIFSLEELQLNITQHRLVPKHERVTEDEKKMLESKYKGKLPLILSSDPVVRYYNFLRGEYLRITRKDGSIISRFVK